ncbi:polysaccharide deacetylase family protein [Candidatus Gracilibacteria bacterium]|nr:polysaccharide deacetylase family protein [Candidatus Gracilibacteria bacterium]
MSFVLKTSEGNRGFVFEKSTSNLLRLDEVLVEDEKILEFVRFTGQDLYQELTDSSRDYFISKDYSVEFSSPDGIKRISLFDLDQVLKETITKYIPDYNERLLTHQGNIAKEKNKSRELYKRDILEAQENIDCEDVSCVALTFDGGPNEKMLEIIKTLDTLEARGTFYVIGQDIFNKSDIFKNSLSKGHEFGNATWSHKDLKELSDEQAREEYSKAQEIIWNIGGIWLPTFRPPFGSFDETKSSLIDSKIIKWDVDSVDWKEDAEARNIANLVTSKTQRNDIVLMHSLNQATNDSLPIIINELRADGYEFVTVSKLLDYKE